MVARVVCALGVVVGVVGCSSNGTPSGSGGTASGGNAGSGGNGAGASGGNQQPLETIVRETQDKEDTVKADVYEDRIATEIRDDANETVKLSAEWDIKGQSVTYQVPNGEPVTLQLTSTPTAEGSLTGTEVIWGNVNAAVAGLFDNPGCDYWPDATCSAPCCADHDRCYEINNCGQSSWVSDEGPCGTECVGCNSAAVSCIVGNAVSYVAGPMAELHRSRRPVRDGDGERS